MLDTVLTFILILVGIKGFWAGDTRELRSFLIVAITFALAYAGKGPVAADMAGAGLDFILADALALILSAIVIFPAAYLLVCLLLAPFNTFGKRIPFRKRLLGVGFALIKGLVLVILIANVLLHSPIRSGVIERSRLLPVFDLNS